MTDTKPDTSAEAVTTWTHDRGKLLGGMSEAPWGAYVALADYRALAAERDEWQKAFGHFLSAIPLGDVIAASGTVQDAIDYFKAAIAERDQLRAELATARNSALDEAAEFVGSLLPENGAGGAQDATDRLIDATRRADVDSIRSLKTNGDSEDG